MLFCYNLSSLLLFQFSLEICCSLSIPVLPDDGASMPEMCYIPTFEMLK